MTKIKFISRILIFPVFVILFCGCNSNISDEEIQKTVSLRKKEICIEKSRINSRRILHHSSGSYYIPLLNMISIEKGLSQPKDYSFSKVSIEVDSLLKKRDDNKKLVNTKSRVTFWEKYLIKGFEYTPNIDIHQIATDFELTGENITNILNYAMLTSLERNDYSIRLRDIELGIYNELKTLNTRDVENVNKHYIEYCNLD